MSCGGIWFDNSEEWNILEEFGFYIKINEIFFS